MHPAAPDGVRSTAVAAVGAACGGCRGPALPARARGPCAVLGLQRVPTPAAPPQSPQTAAHSQVVAHQIPAAAGSDSRRRPPTMGARPLPRWWMAVPAVPFRMTTAYRSRGAVTYARGSTRDGRRSRRVPPRSSAAAALDRPVPELLRAQRPPGWPLGQQGQLVTTSAAAGSLASIRSALLVAWLAPGSDFAPVGAGAAASAANQAHPWRCWWRPQRCKFRCSPHRAPRRAPVQRCR